MNTPTNMPAQPIVNLRAPSGESASVHLFGATVVSWTDTQGRERLFTSSRADLSGSKPIRAGVPISFPQFATLPEQLNATQRARGLRSYPGMPNHGFARSSWWRVVEQRESSATFELTDTEHSRAIWPFAFELRLTVTLDGGLRCRLKVSNPSGSSWPFQAALHTYFVVSNLEAVTVAGLHGVQYRDKVRGGMLCTQEQAAVRFEGETDRVYIEAPSALTLVDPGISPLKLTSVGFLDAVVWNPGPHKAATISDLGSGEHRNFVCVEAALVEQPVTLNPGESWLGEVHYSETE